MVSKIRKVNALRVGHWFGILLVMLAAVAMGVDSLPNIVLLVADDLNYRALGCMDDPVRTPNTDRLASRGVLFQLYCPGHVLFALPQCRANGILSS